MRAKILLIGSILVTAAYAAITPNMNLDKPVTGETNYASKFSTILNQIDAHDHSTGKGVLISSSGLASGAVATVKIADGAVSTAKLATNAVTNVKVDDNAINTAEIADSAVTSAKILDGTIVAADLGTTSVVIAKIADGNVTQAKLQAIAAGTNVTAGNIAVSVGSGTYSNATTGFTDAIAPVTIATTGRPVMINILSDNVTSGTASEFKLESSTTSLVSGEVEIQQDGAVLAEHQFGVDTGSSNPVFEMPCSSITHIGYPAAGTHIYKLRARKIIGTTLYVTRCYMTVKEI